MREGGLPDGHEFCMRGVWGEDWKQRGKKKRVRIGQEKTVGERALQVESSYYPEMVRK